MMVYVGSQQKTNIICCFLFDFSHFCLLYPKRNHLFYVCMCGIVWVYFCCCGFDVFRIYILCLWLLCYVNQHFQTINYHKTKLWHVCFCSIPIFVAFRYLLYSGFCCIPVFVIFRFLLHSGICCIPVFVAFRFLRASVAKRRGLPESSP